MADTYRLTQENSPDPADVAAVREGLAAYNRRHGGDDNHVPIALFVRDTNDAVVGGLLGSLYWGWLAIDILWLADHVRRHGWGSRLVRTAEQMARAHGCYAAHVDTMSFQAREFYEQHGYRVFGVLEDMPRGHQRYYLQKKLTAGEAPD